MNLEMNFTEQSRKIGVDFKNVQAIHDGNGANGKSAYEIAIANGFKGSEMEWLASLQGVDGYTPVKGVDYYTAADKAEIVADVVAALPVYNGEVITV